MMELLIYGLVTVVGLVGFVSWKDIIGYQRRIFIFTETKQKLKAIRAYDAIYLYLAGAFFTSAIISSFAAMVYFDVIGVCHNSWISFTTLLSALEKGELNYTCSFGISFQSVKCEVFSSINRGLFYLVMHFLKWLQDSFSPSNGINPFKILSSLSFFYYLLTSVIHVEVLYVIIRRGTNNTIYLFYSLVYSLHAIHNWREIVVNVSDEPAVAAENEEVQNPSRDDALVVNASRRRTSAR
jgi:hypothetical protein